MEKGLKFLQRTVKGNGTHHLLIGTEGVYNNTWGHLAPRKNITYKGNIIVMKAQHGGYGWGNLILSYDWGGINGPYTHDDTIGCICDNIIIDDEDTGVYKINVSFRNYVYFMGRVEKLFCL